MNDERPTDRALWVLGRSFHGCYPAGLRPCQACTEYQKESDERRQQRTS